MNLYAESSAVLAWLLGEPDGLTVRAALARADLVVASSLTLIECDRVLIRAQASAALAERAAADLRAVLDEAAAHWSLVRIDDAVVERARRPFPSEPVRTLDAIHLASALVARTAIVDLTLLSLDRRVRDAGRALGLEVVPR